MTYHGRVENKKCELAASKFIKTLVYGSILDIMSFVVHLCNCHLVNVSVSVSGLVSSVLLFSCLVKFGN